MEKFKKSNGITLIALVITIIILIILAGISISILLGSDGLIEKTKQGASQYKEESIKETISIATITASVNNNGTLDTTILEQEFDKHFGAGKYTYTVDNTTGEVSVTIDDKTYKNGIPTGNNDNNNNNQTNSYTAEDLQRFANIQLGDTVLYTVGSPITNDPQINSILDNNAIPGYSSGTSPYYGIDPNADGTSGQTSYANNAWKVLSKDSTNNTITITPVSPTNERIQIGGAIGYNNGVQYLNAYCKKYYSNTSYNAIARSMNIDDIEQYYTDSITTTAQSLHSSYGSVVATGGLTPPAMYLLDGEGYYNTEGRFSYDPQQPVGATNGTATVTDGISKNEGSEYYGDVTYTYYDGGNSAMKEKMNNQTVASLIFDNCTNMYWLASRSTRVWGSYAAFQMRYVNAGGGSGSLSANTMYGSNASANGYGTASVKPVVTIPLSHVASTATANQWQVQ